MRLNWSELNKIMTLRHSTTEDTINSVNSRISKKIVIIWMRLNWSQLNKKRIRRRSTTVDTIITVNLRISSKGLLWMHRCRKHTDRRRLLCRIRDWCVCVCVMYESCARVCHVWVLCACVSHLLASEHSSSEPMRNRTNYRHVIGPTKKAEDSADSVEGLKCWGMWNILKKAHVRLKETEKRDPFTV